MNIYKAEINNFNSLINAMKEKILEVEKTKTDQIISIKSELQLLTDLIINKIQTIPILNAQLNAVIEQTNNSINDLITNFLNIDKKLKEQNNNTKNILDNLGFNETKNITILNKHKIVFNNLFNDVTDINSIIQTIFREFVKIINKFNSLNTIIDSIKEFSGKTKILSINAMIESTHAGISGRGFKVVAQEVRTLSDKISSFIHNEEQLIETLLKQSNTQISLLNIEHKKIEDVTNNSKKYITETLNDMDMVINNLKSQLDNFKTSSDLFSKEINKIIISLQFQDIIRQRIEHVIEPLNNIYEEITAKLNLITSLSDKIESIEQQASTDIENFKVNDWLKNYYTIDDEKELLKKHMMNKYNNIKK